MNDATRFALRDEAKEIRFPSTSAGIFNAAIAAAAIAAAFDLGLMNELESQGEVDFVAFCKDRGLDRGSILQIIRALAVFKIIHLNEQAETIRPGEAFEEVNADSGYFLWLLGGYGYALSHLSDLTRNSAKHSHMRDGSFIGRDGRIVSAAAKHYGARYVDREFFAAVEPCQNEVIADLGCGSAARLINMAIRNPGMKGIGIEIDKGAVNLAHELVKSSGCEGRIQLLHADIRNLQPLPMLTSVTIVTSFFMGHDLWPKEHCLVVLQNLRECFPKANRLLLCDTYLSHVSDLERIPTFTLGFELLHALMRQQIPTEAQWIELFAESRWQCVQMRPIGIPYSAIFELKPRIVR